MSTAQADIARIKLSEDKLLAFIAKNAPDMDMFKVQGLINDFNNAVYQYGYNHAREYYTGE